MIRKPNWPRLLTEFTNEHRSSLFAWGRNDCCLFAANWVLKATDIDPASPWRGRYKAPRGAALIIARNGGSVSSLVAGALVRLGVCEIPVSFARRGDIVITTQTEQGQDAAGVCTGVGAIFLTPDGLRTLPIGRCTKAWRLE